MNAKIDGLLLVDKPVGLTSHQVVARVRKLLGIRAIGHAGTLDPMASGLLVLLVGEATKISDYVLCGDKGYRAQVRLGVRTDTQDMTGKVLEEKPVEVSKAQVSAAIDQLQGALNLPVPHYSAVKIAGRKLYEYARAQTAIEAPIRSMNFKQVELTNFDSPLVEVELFCSKGSFVRAWADELGQMLGTGAALAQLTRIHSHPYDLCQAVPLKALEELWAECASLESLRGQAYIPLATTLPLFSEVRVRGREFEMIRNGQIASSLRGRLLQDLRHSSGRKIVDEHGTKLLALIVSDSQCNLKVRRVFHY